MRAYLFNDLLRYLDCCKYVCGSSAIRGLFGGRDRNRTCDPQHAMLMLSQLSYTPSLLRRARSYGNLKLNQDFFK